MTRSNSKASLRRSVKRLRWRDRVRENSVVRKFGPISRSSSLNLQTTTIGNGCFSDGEWRECMCQNNCEDANLVRSLRELSRATKPHSQASAPGLKNPSKGNLQGDAGQRHTDVRTGDKYAARGAGRPSDETDRYDHKTHGMQDNRDDNGNQMARLVTHYFTYPPADMSASSDLEDADIRAASVSEEAGLLTWDYDGCADQEAYDPMKAMIPQKSLGLGGDGAEAGDSGGTSGVEAGGGRFPEQVEVSSVSYLSVPDTTSSRRPSTADIVIEKLQMEKVEGGGLSIQGVALASNCHVTLSVFGVFFMVAGVILSYVSYSVNMTVSNVSVRYPVMQTVFKYRVRLNDHLALEASESNEISQDEKAKQLVISERQLCQLENSFTHDNVSTSPMHTAAPAPHQQYPILAVRRNSWWVDPSSVMDPSGDTGRARSARDSAVQCPSPLGESQGGTPPRILTPVPIEMLPDLSEACGDIACFPPSRNPMTPLAGQQQVCPLLESSADSSNSTTDHTVSTFPPLSADPHNTTPLLYSAAQELRTGTFIPSSAGPARSHGALPPNTQIPSIQVTAAAPQNSAGPVLPRLSRHCSTRLDSRPTTAEPR
ncbi:uncharacterized protein [Panulirus ornatus]|uniref:uncharacterized protein n=1 Tax=Panulirus ornatus TaxID=150431 RepID=UPI003A85B4BA